MQETILTFKRYEKKYLLSARKFELLWERLREHLVPDLFHRSTVCSIYYDSDDFSLIRHSLEKPVYKEKLRLRSYNVPGPDGEVFVELKKKYKGVVYKRRVRMSAVEAERYLAGQSRPPEDGQILREIDFFLQTHEVSPKAFIACEREAWVDREEPELRITFDRNLRWRDSDLHLSSGSGGEPLLPDGEVLMEIKIPGAAPLWLAHLLSELEIFPTSFSKYGTCYRQDLLEKYFNGVIVCV
ncbi:MAG: polyphosphate polymerase domain-containing protein [Oscillospiraceae bacterium]|nr:polyphosphate polymerase domain-containing protein [Oscillospiraceae bacterium]MBR0311851.1 polyphosphate polymerase domain-containing protein [Oscillospiraceae bacterium]